MVSIETLSQRSEVLHHRSLAVIGIIYPQIFLLSLQRLCDREQERFDVSESSERRLAVIRLIHVPELAEGPTENVEDVVKKGEVITAKCLGVDEKGRVKMSRRAWLRDQKAEEAEAAGVSGD